MKIGIIAPYSRPWDTNDAEGSGINTFVRESAEALAQAGHEIVVFRRTSRAQDKKIQTHSYGVKERAVTAGRRTRLSRKDVYTACIKNPFPLDEVADCDALIGHYWIAEAWISQIEPQYYSKILYFSHSYFCNSYRLTPVNRLHENAEIRLLQKVIWCANSRMEYNDMKQLARPNRLTLVRPGSSPIPAERSKNRQREGFLFLGRKNEAKGYDLFCKLAQEFPEQSFCAIGRPELDSPVLPNLETIEHLPLSELSRYVANSACVICPSRYENFGLVPLLAFSQSVPVIASRRGGYPDVISHQKTGLLYNGSYQGLKKQVKKMIDDGIKMDSSKRDKTLAQFSWERFAERINAIVMQKEEIYSGRILSVEKRPVVTNQGNVIMFEQVRLPGSIHVLPVSSENKVLLISEHRPEEGQTRNKILSGIVEEGETEVEAAHRELQEELGLCAGTMKKLLEVKESATVHDTRTYYLAKDLSPCKQPSLEKGEEIHGTVSVDVDSLFSQALNGAFGTSKSVFAILALHGIVTNGFNPFQKN